MFARKGSSIMHKIYYKEIPSNLLIALSWVAENTANLAHGTLIVLLLTLCFFSVNESNKKYSTWGL